MQSKIAQSHMNLSKYFFLFSLGMHALFCTTVASAFPDYGEWQKKTEYTHGAYLLKISDGAFITNSHYSVDGGTWKEVKYPSHGYWLNGSGYGAGTFVLTGAVGQIFTSNDFENWIPRSPGGVDVINVTYGNNTFIAAQYYRSSIWHPSSLWSAQSERIRVH
jgi:hypothetical protein